MRYISLVYASTADPPLLVQTGPFSFQLQAFTCRYDILLLVAPMNKSCISSCSQSQTNLICIPRLHAHHFRCHRQDSRHQRDCCHLSWQQGERSPREGHVAYLCARPVPHRRLDEERGCVRAGVRDLNRQCVR